MAGAAKPSPMPRKQPRRCKHASLPLDLLLEIAARTEPATLVRCAATCKELRRHIAKPVFHGRLRRGERFVPSLLRGCLVSRYRYDLELLDNTTADATKLLSAATCTCFPPAADGEAAVKCCRPLAARDGLVLLCGSTKIWDLGRKLCVCCPATGRCQALPPEPRGYGHYVLLVGSDGQGGGAVGRPFQVLKVHFVKSGRKCYLQIDRFSSEQGAWAPPVRVSNPLFNSGGLNILPRPGNSVVIRDTVHWLHWQGKESQPPRTMFHVLKLHVGATLRVTMAELPESFHSTCRSLRWKTWQILLATSPAGRSLTVLVASNDVIYAWSQSERTGRWKKQPELIKDFGAMKLSLGKRVRLEWFAERSGVVLLVAPDSSSTFLLDLQSKDIIKSSSSSTIILSGGTFPYEMDASSWAPTFTKIF
ncbi:unnamed protein product [Urochloa humidicola]